MVKVFKNPNVFEKKLNTPIIQQKEYSQNWVEWAIKNLTLVFFDGTTYTVPSNRNLYIVFLQGSVATDVGLGQIFINLSGVAPIRIFSCRNSNNPSVGVVTAMNQNCNFYPPIKLNPNDTLSFTGWDRVNGFGFLEIAGKTG